MGSILEKTTDFLGLTDHEGEQDARDAANAQMARSNQLTDEQIAFQREQYDDWKSIYGPLQEDLGTYYKNLTGDAMAAQQIVQTQMASQSAQRQTDAALAQRGISGGGLEASLLAQNTFGTEMQKAGIRANKDQLAAQQQAGFLGIGLGQGTQMLGIQAGVANAGSGVAGSMASTALGNATSLSQSSTAAMADIYGSILGSSNGSGGTVGSSISSGVMSMFSDNRLKDSISKVGVLNGINFYTWEWNKKANALGYYGKGFGVIAQEVNDIIPSSVYKDNDYYGVNYDVVLNYIKGTKWV